MSAGETLWQHIHQAIQPSRLVAAAIRLIEIPSPTGNAGAVADRLSEILQAEGFQVERPIAAHPAAPAVVALLDSGQPGPTLQFNGHLDTVHLPFVPPTLTDDLLTGSGASDMKGGMAAALEAVLILRDSGLLTRGRILLTAHDLHEAPWGQGQQLDQLIRDGIVGDAVLLPEPLCDKLPLAGRGAATWKVHLRRAGAPVHEVMRPLDEPSVIAAGGDLILQLEQLNEQLAVRTHPLAGAESVFIGQIHAGEIYNQFPQECWLEGTRRWLPGTARDEVEASFRQLLARLSEKRKVAINADFRFIRDAFLLEEKSSLVQAFQQSYALLQGEPLGTGAKPFVDDGNSFWGLAGVPAITHGPKAGGQHTVREWVSVADLQRVAQLYALTALTFCNAG